MLEVNKRVYYCKECSEDLDAGDVVYWCKRCKETTEHEHKRSKLRGNVGLPNFKFNGPENENDDMNEIDEQNVNQDGLNNE